MAIPRKTRLRSDKYNANITKRGLVSQQAAVEKKEKETSYVNPILVGFLFFVLAGSSIFQIIRNAQAGPIF
eukprot:gene9684-6930_t